MCLCALLYRRGRSSCLRLQRNATTASYRTRQPGSFWRQASTFQTVSWGSEMTSAGVQKTQAQHLTTRLTNCRQDCIASSQSRNVQLETALHTNIRVNTKNIAMLNKQPHQQGNPWPKAATPSFCGSLLLPSIGWFQRIAPSGSL